MVQKNVKSLIVYPLVEYANRFINCPLILAFIERWYPETNTFHLPFSEMAISLNNVHRILGIPVIGNEWWAKALRE